MQTLDACKIQTRGSRRKFFNPQARPRTRQRALQRMLATESGSVYLMWVTKGRFMNAQDLRDQVFSG